MKLLFGSFWRAVAYCLYPRVLMLTLLPLLVAGVVTLGLGYLYWAPALDAVRGTLEHWRLVNSMLEWISSMLGANFRTGIAALIVIALTIPVVVAFTLVLVGLWITPAVVTLVSRRRFGALAAVSRVDITLVPQALRAPCFAAPVDGPLVLWPPSASRCGRVVRSWWLGALASFAWTAVAMLAVLVTLPLWLVPGLALVLPPLIWGWLTAKVMGFDALAEHASQPEREAILRAHRWPLLVMGITCGFLCGVPSLIWTLSMQVIILAPLVMVGVIWLYTLIFTFSALWFVHYALAVLDALRGAEAAVRAAPAPSMAPVSDLPLVEEVPPHERFGHDTGPAAGQLEDGGRP